MICEYEITMGCIFLGAMSEYLARYAHFKSSLFLSCACAMRRFLQLTLAFVILILARVAMTGIFVCIHIQTISYHIFQLLYVYSY